MMPAHADQLTRASRSARAVCDTSADAALAVKIYGPQYVNMATFQVGGKVYVDFWTN
jgi:hypothetical protein